jgi:plasmid replication initiation protein
MSIIQVSHIWMFHLGNRPIMAINQYRHKNKEVKESYRVLAIFKNKSRSTC